MMKLHRMVWNQQPLYSGEKAIWRNGRISADMLRTSRDNTIIWNNIFSICSIEWYENCSTKSFEQEATSELKQTKAINLAAVERKKVRRGKPQKASKAEKLTMFNPRRVRYIVFTLFCFHARLARK